MCVLRPPASTSPYTGAAVAVAAAGAVGAGLFTEAFIGPAILRPAARPCRRAVEIPFAAGLFQQPDVLDADVVREGLAHIVDRERRDGGAGQGLHLDPGAVMHGNAASDDDGAARRGFN